MKYGDVTVRDDAPSDQWKWSTDEHAWWDSWLAPSNSLASWQPEEEQRAVPPPPPPWQPHGVWKDPSKTLA